MGRKLTMKRTPMRANKSLRLWLTDPEKRKKLMANWTNRTVMVTTKLTKRLRWKPKRPAEVLESRPFFGKMFKPRSDVVADKCATEDQTVVKMVDEEGLEQTVAEETTSLTKEAELEDKYITLDKPEPVEEDENKKEPTPNTSF